MALIFSSYILINWRFKCYTCMTSWLSCVCDTWKEVILQFRWPGAVRRAWAFLQHFCRHHVQTRWLSKSVARLGVLKANVLSTGHWFKVSLKCYKQKKNIIVNVHLKGMALYGFICHHNYLNFIYTQADYFFGQCCRLNVCNTFFFRSSCYREKKTAQKICLK